MHAGSEGGHSPARNLVLLTTPVDTSESLYTSWVGRESFDVDFVADSWDTVPGASVDFANKLIKPVTNFWTTNREAHQAMAKWVADNPPFPGRAFREWITWMYKQNQLVRGRMRVRGERVDLGRIEQNLLVVTAGADHITPRSNTLPLLDLVRSEDIVTL